MLRASNTSPRSAGRHIASRRRHQFVPSIGGAAAPLEDRALLSGMGTMGLVAAVHPLSATPPPNSSVGPIIANSAMPQSDPPNSSVGPIVANSSAPRTPASDPPPNSSVGPIVANSSAPRTPASDPPPNSSVGPIIA